jgi:DNA-binding NarL/FixJ family response regulator
VRTALEGAGLGVSEAGEASEARAAVGSRMPDLVLLDVRLPHTSGYEVYRELRDRCGDALPIIFVSGERVDAYDRVAGLGLGAEDYLVKPLDTDELVARVSRSLKPRGNGHGDETSEASTPLDELTQRELEVLMLLGDGRSSKEIAADLVISPRTVGTHVQHILGKLGVSSRTQAVAIAHRTSLARVPEVEAHVANASREPVRLAS